MNEETRKLLIELIDCVRDLNKSVSMHIHNHNSESVNESIYLVAVGISNKLQELTDELNNVPQSLT